MHFTGYMKGGSNEADQPSSDDQLFNQVWRLSLLILLRNPI
ncbi:hypothetical protein SAMN05421882_10537 [Nitrosomonas communis]|uniref:Uncharacterized protein n=1 Tax=Nitrosomonas communis TaxID=44574 RepID=A0A1H2YL14_9PROT|nr:hypothetical protein SAMN05421882_10537 [Nitrosomonas communis]